MRWFNNRADVELYTWARAQIISKLTTKMRPFFGLSLLALPLPELLLSPSRAHTNNYQLQAHAQDPGSPDPSDSETSQSSAEAARAARARRFRQLQSRRGPHAHAAAASGDVDEGELNEEDIDRLLGDADTGTDTEGEAAEGQDGNNNDSPAALLSGEDAAFSSEDAVTSESESEPQSNDEDEDSEERTPTAPPGGGAVYASSRDYNSSDPDDRVGAGAGGDSGDEDGDGDSQRGGRRRRQASLGFTEDPKLTGAVGEKVGCAVEGPAAQDGPDGALLYRMVREGGGEPVPVALYYLPGDGKPYIPSR